MNKEFITILRFNEATQNFDRLYKYKDGTEKYFSRGVDRSNEYSHLTPAQKNIQKKYE